MAYEIDERTGQIVSGTGQIVSGGEELPKSGDAVRVTYGDASLEADGYAAAVATGAAVALGGVYVGYYIATHSKETAEAISGFVSGIADFF